MSKLRAKLSKHIQMSSLAALGSSPREMAGRYALGRVAPGRSRCLRGAWIQLLRVSPSIELRASFNGILVVSSAALGTSQRHDHALAEAAASAAQAIPKLCAWAAEAVSFDIPSSELGMSKLPLSSPRSRLGIPPPRSALAQASARARCSSTALVLSYTARGCAERGSSPERA